LEKAEATRTLFAESNEHDAIADSMSQCGYTQGGGRLSEYEDWHEACAFAQIQVFTTSSAAADGHVFIPTATKHSIDRSIARSFGALDNTRPLEFEIW